MASVSAGQTAESKCLAANSCARRISTGERDASDSLHTDTMTFLRYSSPEGRYIVGRTGVPV